MSTESDVVVLWLSKAESSEGLFNVLHTHDYFHLSVMLSGDKETSTEILRAPRIYCAPPGCPHSGGKYITRGRTVNIMFLVFDKHLYKMIESFPFEKLSIENAHLPLLKDIVETVGTHSPDADTINAAFSYYIRKVMLTNKSLIATTHPSLAEQCCKFIHDNYMNPIKLADISDAIGRTPSYTSALFSNTYGITIVDYLNQVRISNACKCLSYTDIPMEKVYLSCGFSNARSFSRVFKSIVGITPNNYRTSHRVRDFQYDGNPDDIKNDKINTGAFTYVCAAQKRVDWMTTYDYMMQRRGDPDNTAPYDPREDFWHW